MERILRIGLAALLLPALFACTGRKTADRVEWQEGERMAVAFLGYYDSFSTFKAAPSYVRLTRTFPEIVEAVQVDAAMGREIYLVVPRDAQTVLTVEEDGSFVSDESRRVFYSGAGKPVLVHNNFYDPNTRIICTDASGRTLTYVPQTDKKSGALQVTVGGGVRDISLPIPAPMEGYTYFDYGTDFEDRDLGIRLRLEAGRPVLTLSQGPLAALGYDGDSFRINDGDNEFSGINGLCKGVFLGTIGQDYNPVACVVMENGEVKKCSVFYAMQHGEPVLSAPLPSFKDVVGFEQGGGGPYEVDGETYYEYQTIYALDARGERTELPQFLDYGLYVAQDGDATIEVDLTPDWQFYLNRYGADSSLEEFGSGSFYELERTDGLDRFRFVLSRLARQDGADFKVDERERKGRFSAREVGLSYEITLSGADLFPSGTEFRDISLLDADEDIEYD